MSVEALSWCKNQGCQTPTSKLVLFVLANYCDERHSCYPSERHIAHICGISPRSVRRCLVSLQALGLVAVQRRSGTSNRYFLAVDTDVQSRVDTDVHTPRSRASTNTKDIQKKKRSLNAIAG